MARLNVRNMDLDGSIPSELGMIHNLTSLNPRTNDLTPHSPYQPYKVCRNQ